MQPDPAVTVRVRPHEGRLLIRFGRHSFTRVLDAVKALPGRTYHPERALWTAPEPDAAIRALHRALGRDQVWIIDDRPLLGPEPPRSCSTSDDPSTAGRSRPSAGAHPRSARKRHDSARTGLPSATTDRPGRRPDRRSGPPEARTGKALLERVRAALDLKGYSTRTRKVYLGHLTRFLTWCGGGTPTLPVEPARQAQAYLLELVHGRGVSRSYHNQAVSALRFLCETVLGQPRLALRIPRPRKDRKLPAVLSPEEVGRLLSKTRNLKHRALLMLLYSAGLRVSEVVRLRPADLDVDRGLVRVRNGKGGKDRYTLLARRAVEAVILYRGAYPARPWLFPGGMKGTHLTTRSVQRIVQESARAAGIEKHVTAHTLRHSFATHLLEGGTNLRVIQELLGHQSARTTQIYTHVARSTLGAVPNPLDRLD